MFDSPLLWIVVIWWLLTTILGVKARQRRAQARSASPDQPAAPPGPPEAAVRRELPPERGRPQGVEIEGEVPGEQPPAVPGEVEPPSRPTSPLENLFRGLGITEELIPEGLRPGGEVPWEEEPAPAPELETAAEPEAAPEPERGETPPEPPCVERHLVSEREPVTPPTRHYPLLAGTALARLTPLQQAVVLKEILDRPRALHRDIR